MSFDLSSLSSGPLLYFLAHSTLFVVIIAMIFFAFGLAFGWFTWARYKSQRRDALAENDSLKDEIATLKRKLAEQIARASSLADASPPTDTQPSRPAHAGPDPVINSFLSTAAAILPQADKPEQNPHNSVQRMAVPERESLPDESGEPRKPLVISKVKLGNSVFQTLIHKDAGHDLVDQAGGDLAFPDLPDSVSDLSTEPGQQSSKAEEGASTPPPITADSNGSSRLLSDPHMGLVYATRPGLSDDLCHLKGVANVIEGRLNDYGVYTFKQIALWSEENIREFSNLLAFKDRIHREQWVEQARELHFQKYGERL